MSLSPAPLRTSWRAAETARRMSISRRRGSVLLLLSPGAGRTKVRAISTFPSNPRTSHHENRTRHAFVWVLSTSIALGAVLHGGLQSSIMMDSPPPAAMRPPPEQAVLPSFKEKVFQMLVPEPTSNQHVSSFMPAQPVQEVDQRLKFYDSLYDELLDISTLPKEQAILTSAPRVPPPITRDYPVVLQVPLTTDIKTTQLTGAYKYEQWTFNDTVPGPFIRARVGDIVELKLTNRDQTGNPHNIDCHAFTGPGGGAALTTTEENESKTAMFKLLNPGLYVYHCAAAPVPVHIANGMYGLMYVQPSEGDLPQVDREYYVMQSEFYHEPPEVMEDGRRSSLVEFSYPSGLREEPSIVVFNGSESAMTRDRPLKANVDETVRVFFGNVGPNLTSSFHVIGSCFRNVYRDGDVVSNPGHFIQTVGVPPGGATIVDMKMAVPGTYALVDHAIFRLDKGAMGYLNVSGKPKANIYQSLELPAPCVGCKLHA